MEKKYEFCELKNGKYGERCRALVAKERILAGEVVMSCVTTEDIRSRFTRKQLLGFIKEYPKLEWHINAMNYIIDDDIHEIASNFREEKVMNTSQYMNHSCDPNLGYVSDGNAYIAIKDIEPGEELVFHYGFLEPETSSLHDLKCVCGTKDCNGILDCSKYRDENFVKKYFDYLSPYIKQKIEDMKTRWYSPNCYVKRIPSKGTNNIAEWKTCLSSLKEIKKDDLVASFSSYDKINENGHFIRHADQPNCYLKDRDVFASVDIPPDTELTISFN